MPSQPGLQLRPSDTYLAAVERCEAIVDPHPQYIAGERDMKCDRPIEILGWNSNKCIRYSICAVSDLPACIEANLPSNQSLAEQILCFVGPSPWSHVSCSQIVHDGGRQRRYAVAPGSAVDQDFDALANREEIDNTNGGDSAHAAAISSGRRSSPTSVSIYWPHRSRASLRSARKS